MSGRPTATRCKRYLNKKNGVSGFEFADRQSKGRGGRDRTDVVRLVKDNDRLPAQLLRDLLGNLGIEQVVERVDDDVDERHHPPEGKVGADVMLAAVVLDVLEREDSGREEVAWLTRSEDLQKRSGR